MSTQRLQQLCRVFDPPPPAPPTTNGNGHQAPEPAAIRACDGFADLPVAPVLTCLADVEPRDITWLWRRRFAAGRLSLIAGRPGEGKSFATADMASRVSTGTPWPDGASCVGGDVLLVTAEDDPHDVIRPRLDALGADVSRIHLINGVRRLLPGGKTVEVCFTLGDIAALEAALGAAPDVQARHHRSHRVIPGRRNRRPP